MSVSMLLATADGRQALDNVLKARDARDTIRVQIARLQREEAEAERVLAAAIAFCDGVPPVQVKKDLQDMIPNGTKVYSQTRLRGGGHDTREGTYDSEHNKIRYNGDLMSISGFGKKHIKDMKDAGRTDRADVSFDWREHLKVFEGGIYVKVRVSELCRTFVR